MAPTEFKPKGKADSTEAVYWWLIDNRTGFVGGDVEHYLHMAASAATVDAVGQLAQQSIDFQPDYQRVVLHRLGLWRDGRWQDRRQQTDITVAQRESEFEQARTVGGKSLLLVVSDVRAGDIVEFSYTLAGSNPILKGMRGTELYLNGPFPTRRLHAEIVRQAGSTIRARLRGPTKLTLPEFKPAGAFERLIIEQTDLAAVVIEDRVPPDHLLTASLEASEVADWAAVVDWGVQLFQTDPADGALDAVLPGLRSAPTPEQQILAALHFVQQDVRYFGQMLGENTHRPHALAQILDKRLGDCKDKSLLLVSLLRALGFNAWPALYSTESREAVLDVLPRGSVFDHVVVMLEHDGRRYWLDPTVSEQRGNLDQLGFYTHGAALVLKPGETAPTRTAPVTEQPSRVHIQERLQLAEDGSGELMVQFRYERELAESQRSHIGDAGQRQMERAYQDYYIARFGPLAPAGKIEWKLDEAGNAVSITQHYQLPPPTQGSAPPNDLRVENSGLQELFALPGVQQRRMPLSLVHPLALEYEFQLNLAGARKVRQLPEPVNYEAPGFSFSQQVQSADGWLTIKQSASSSAQRVAAADVPAYVAALTQAREHAGMRLRLVSPAGEDEDRRERLRRLLQGN